MEKTTETIRCINTILLQDLDLCDFKTYEMVVSRIERMYSFNTVQIKKWYDKIKDENYTLVISNGLVGNKLLVGYKKRKCQIMSGNL